MSMWKRHWKKGSFLLALNFIIYDISILISRQHFDFHLFLYYILTLDIIFVFIIFPFFMNFKPVIRSKDELGQEQIRLLYQALIPGADRISDAELYDIINLRISIPEHTCSKEEYIQHLKRKGLLIINGQHIWVYGKGNLVG